MPPFATGWRNARDKNFTEAKTERRLQRLDESIARYLSQLETADRQGKAAGALALLALLRPHACMALPTIPVSLPLVAIESRIRIGERNLFVLALYQVEHLNAIDAASKISGWCFQLAAQLRVIKSYERPVAPRSLRRGTGRTDDQERARTSAVTRRSRSVSK